MPTDPDLLFEKAITKFNFIKVFKNRVLISEGTFAGTEHTILLRQIASVNLEGPAKILKIVTVGGETFRPKFIAGKTAQEAQAAILSQL
jgi:hypothetical protein